MNRATTWKRIRRSLRGCRPKLSFGLIMFEEEFCLDLFGFLIALPFMDRWLREPEDMLERWGVYYFDRTAVFEWGDFSKRWRMPWDYEHIKCEVQRPDGSWVPYVGSWESKEPDGRKIWNFDYTYTLKSGEVQHRTAEVYVERQERRRLWLRWTPLFAKVRTYIDYSFSDEVGERSGSWKGGAISSSEELRYGESVEECFRRMERERKFN